ncbi:hypothetical protein PHMEG_0006168 [Phytophthora megakarya]|uniref:Uncharacterized protein n=1 Tax=Phytophthora megakarya TaxID=4795 RepID=A0A225WR99_9STRA|nr:hypothetical protein PHMEG_0006168 [Phytophthora megakarya]
MNRNIIAYFVEGLGDNHSRCKTWGMARKQAPGTGYSNRIGHLAAKHNAYQAVYDTATISQSIGTFGFVSETTNIKAYEGLNGVYDYQGGNALKNNLGDIIGLIFDGWSHVSLHYVGIYVVYECDDQRRQPLLGVSPLDEGYLTVYNKTYEMVCFLVTDTCATNQSISQLKPFYGTWQYRFATL